MRPHCGDERTKLIVQTHKQTFRQRTGATSQGHVADATQWNNPELRLDGLCLGPSEVLARDLPTGRGAEGLRSTRGSLCH